MRIVRRDEARVVPWRNGGGVTHEIVAVPEGAGFDDFVWRLSRAEVAADGPFSPFPGVDRTLTLTAGRGMTLDFGAGSVAIDPLSPPLAFPGEAPVTGWLTAGPVEDFNVMTRRCAAAHRVVVLDVPGPPLPEGCCAVLCRDGAVTLGAARLAPGDCALLAPAGEGVSPGGSGRIVAVCIEIVDAGRAANDDPHWARPTTAPPAERGGRSL